MRVELLKMSRQKILFFSLSKESENTTGASLCDARVGVGDVKFEHLEVKRENPGSIAIVHESELRVLYGDGEGQGSCLFGRFRISL